MKRLLNRVFLACMFLTSIAHASASWDLDKALQAFELCKQEDAIPVVLLTHAAICGACRLENPNPIDQNDKATRALAYVYNVYTQQGNTFAHQTGQQFKDSKALRKFLKKKLGIEGSKADKRGKRALALAAHILVETNSLEYGNKKNVVTKDVIKDKFKRYKKKTIINLMTQVQAAAKLLENTDTDVHGDGEISASGSCSSDPNSNSSYDPSLLEGENGQATPPTVPLNTLSGSNSDTHLSGHETSQLDAPKTGTENKPLLSGTNDNTDNKKNNRESRINWTVVKIMAALGVPTAITLAIIYKDELARLFGIKPKLDSESMERLKSTILNLKRALLLVEKPQENLFRQKCEQLLKDYSEQDMLKVLVAVNQEVAVS